jgi:hypothetical protein
MGGAANPVDMLHLWFGVCPDQLLELVIRQVFEFEIRDSNRPLSFFNIATIRLQHRQVRRHAVGFLSCNLFCTAHRRMTA